ncbi:MAG: IS66 family insertion sequence element accessory protein TnpA [Thiobacillaceae bacterium]
MARATDSGKLALWRERFERFSRGERAVGPFCARERVSVASFYYWREKVGERGRRGEVRPRTDRRNVFRPVTVVPAAPAVRIQLPCGVRIEVGTDDLEVVRAVVGVVARSDAGRHGSDGTC